MFFNLLSMFLLFLLVVTGHQFYHAMRGVVQQQRWTAHHISRLLYDLRIDLALQIRGHQADIDSIFTAYEGRILDAVEGSTQNSEDDFKILLADHKDVTRKYNKLVEDHKLVMEREKSMELNINDLDDQLARITLETRTSHHESQLLDAVHRHDIDRLNSHIDYMQTLVGTAAERNEVLENALQTATEALAAVGISRRHSS
jgi:hypothetical protein